MPGRRAFAFASSFAVATLGSAAAWAEPPADVDVRCEALGEDRDALEARARADLAARGIAGRLTVTCNAESLQVALDRPGLAPLQRVEKMPGERAATVDVALAALDALFAEAAPARPVAPPRLGLIPPPPPPPPTLVATPEEKRRWLWFAAGGDFQAWAGSGAPGAVGFYAAVRLLRGPVSFDLQGGARIAVGVPGAFSLRMGEGIFGADVTMPFAPWASVGAGAGFTYLVAVGDKTSPEELSSASMVGRLRARGRIDLGDLDIHVGPELRVAAPPASVQDHGVEVVRVPVVSFGAALDFGLAP